MYYTVPAETSKDYHSGTIKVRKKSCFNQLWLHCVDSLLLLLFSQGNQYNFAGVFDENVLQKTIFHIVALPLVQDLLNGKDDLFLIAGTAKTHTMHEVV